MIREDQKNLVPGKSASRVPAWAERYPEEWNAQYNMLLQDGFTCENCVHCDRCIKFFGQKKTDTSCQFYPNKYSPIVLSKNKGGG